MTSKAEVIRGLRVIVQDMRDKGQRDEAIRAALRLEGWPAGAIQEAME